MLSRHFLDRSLVFNSYPHHHLLQRLKKVEPCPNIPKLHNPGVKLSRKALLPSRVAPSPRGVRSLEVTDVTPNFTVLLRASSSVLVEKSAAEMKVPARGEVLVPTDLSIAIPKGTYDQMVPRAGLAWKHSIDVSVRMMDHAHWGDSVQHSDVDFVVKVGDRIAQLIIEKIMTPMLRRSWTWTRP
ncbi:hypothetical protein ACJRO7_014318 [Eucalyptus globulus]|uniref:Deoxyuridine 5'-triphosphate nucleotidohydrolase n=1 Tax=Eucalyptus globulus TaxID=34317 RepID=A0ABD3L0V7_EUCGL